jgi:hypothetical protein
MGNAQIHDFGNLLVGEALLNPQNERFLFSNGKVGDFLLKSSLLFGGDDEIINGRLLRDVIHPFGRKLNSHARLLAMPVHRSIATTFEKPSLDVILNPFSWLPAQGEENVLDTVSGVVPIPTQ